MPRFGAENLLIEAQSIRWNIENRTWKGQRHVQALPVRTRRTSDQVTARKMGKKRGPRLGYPIILTDDK